MRGLRNADGTSVLLKFASLLEGDDHIKVVYLEYKGHAAIMFSSTNFKYRCW